MQYKIIYNNSTLYSVQFINKLIWCNIRLFTTAKNLRKFWHFLSGIYCILYSTVYSILPCLIFLFVFLMLFFLSPPSNSPISPGFDRFFIWFWWFGNQSGGQTFSPPLTFSLPWHHYSDMIHKIRCLNKKSRHVHLYTVRKAIQISAI